MTGDVESIEEKKFFLCARTLHDVKFMVRGRDAVLIAPTEQFSFVVMCSRGCTSFVLDSLSCFRVSEYSSCLDMT